MWSANYTTDDFPAGYIPTLGEAVSYPPPFRKWRNGSLAAAPPPDRLVGSAECIADGERYPLPLLDRTLIAGIDSRCWPIAPDGVGPLIDLGVGLLQYLPFWDGAELLLSAGVPDTDEAEVGAQIAVSAGLSDAETEAVGADVLLSAGLSDEIEAIGADVLLSAGLNNAEADTVGADVLLSAGLLDPGVDQVGAEVLLAAGLVDGETEDVGVELLLSAGLSAEEPDYFECDQCPDGTWSTWSFTIDDATGDFAMWNGTWVLVSDGGCGWVLDPPSEDFFITLSFDIFGFARLDFVMEEVEAHYLLLVDCLGPMVLAVTGITGLGTMPLTITVTGSA